MAFVAKDKIVGSSIGRSWPLKRSRPGYAPVDGVQRRYLLVALVECAGCGLRAESQWAHGRAAYRCRHRDLHQNHPRRRPPDRRRDHHSGRLAAARTINRLERRRGDRRRCSPAERTQPNQNPRPVGDEGTDRDRGPFHGSRPRMVTGSPTAARIPTPPRRPTARSCTACNPTRSPHPSCNGSSPSTSPDAA